MKRSLIQKILNFFIPFFFHLKLRFDASIKQIRPWIDEMNSNKLPNFIQSRTGWHSWTNYWSVSLMSVVSKLVEKVTAKLGCMWISIIGKERVKVALKKRDVWLQSWWSFEWVTKAEDREGLVITIIWILQSVSRK